MFTLRTMGGVALLLAGSTWLWLTPAFASHDVSTSAVGWTVTNVLALLTVVGFTVATVGLFARQSWWENVAIASAVLGLMALVPYCIAALGGGETAGTAAWNVLVHVLMLTGVFVLLTVPSLEQWVHHQVMR